MTNRRRDRHDAYLKLGVLRLGVLGDPVISKVAR
jgi:hypothetical protein